MLHRFHQDLGGYLKSGKVLIIYGPRRAGKTTLLEDFLGRSGYRYRLDSGDNRRVQEVLGSADFDRIKGYVKGYELVAIDEAQQIPNVGMGLKIIADQMPDVRVIVTGSSLLDLSFTGRKRILTLYPMAQVEFVQEHPPTEIKERLEEFLIFGQFPEIVIAQNRKDKIELLQGIVDSYLLRDILTLERVKGSEILFRLVQLLSFQVGQPVSHGELATQLHLDQKTVARYIDLLEKSFVIHRLGGFSRNLRKEITKKAKYYFLDNGIRNGVISHFNRLEDRADVGALWENFLFSERIKRATYLRDYALRYFWRTYDGQEIDFVEEIDGDLSAYEAKWSPPRVVKPPSAWKDYYPSVSYEIITPENYFDFVS